MSAREDLLDRAMLGAGLMGGGANVIMQLARPGVGYGVVESVVDTGDIFRHPVKRTRTTLTYLAVAMIGTEEEKKAYRRAVNRSHARVRSTPASPVPYHAFDPDLQLWVAACLYRGFEDTHRMFIGPLSDDDAEEFYRASVTLGATLQMRAESWPPSRAAFEEYWSAALDQVRIDDAVRAHLNRIVTLRYLPRPVSLILGPVHRFVTTGYLPPRFRDEMRLPWSPRQQRRFDRFIALTAAIVRRSPRLVRRFPFDLLMWDLRRRIRTGRPLV